MNLPILRMTYKWNHVVLVLFISHSIFKKFLCWSIYPLFFFFLQCHGSNPGKCSTTELHPQPQILFHFMVEYYSFVCVHPILFISWTLGCLKSLAIVNDGTVNIDI
jgi:hypothetical protein